jgi:hypothetical protein
MQRPALILFLAAGVGVMSGCGSLENLTCPAKVWDDGQSRLLFGGPRADWAAVQKCLEDDADGSQRVAVLAGRALDTPLSAAADVCCYGVVGAACVPLIALYCMTNAQHPMAFFGR